MKREFLLYVSIIFSLISCKTIEVLNEIKKDNVDIKTISFQKKTIKFIPMHHLGKMEFYDDVKKNIQELKNNGYKVYYEKVISEFKGDSIQIDIVKRKFRKIKGFEGTYEDVAKGTFLDKYINQPPYDSLGVTKDDLNVDVTYLDFINEWEKQFGTIALDSIDLKTNLNSNYKRRPKHSKNKFYKIAIEYRNIYLVNRIKSSGDEKILVIYGKGHLKDFENRIKL